MNKAAFQSSVYEFGAASLAVDGNTNGNWWTGKSCAHTGGEDRPWWAVDLGFATTVSEVEITNRIDAVPGRPYDNVFRT